MLESFHEWQRRWAVIPSALLAGLVLVPLLWTAPAGAIPLYFNGPDPGADGNLGVALMDAGPLPDVADATAAGVPTFDPTQTFPGTGFNFLTPDPITVDTQRPATPSLADPVTGTTTWQVTNGTGTSYQDLWLVFRGLSPLDANGFADESTGLELPPAMGAPVPGASWALLHVVDGGDEFWYPSVFLGDVASGATVPATLHYRVLEDPYPVNQDYTFPRLRVGLAVAVPEPTTALLFAVGLLGFGCARRRSR